MLLKYLKHLSSFLISLFFLFVFLSSADLLEKVGELVEKLFDTDEELMKSWITAQPREEDDAESHPDVVVCLLEAAKQLRWDFGEHSLMIRSVNALATCKLFQKYF